MHSYLGYGVFALQRLVCLQQALLKSVGDFRNHIAVVHSTTQIRERAPDVGALLIVPIGQKVMRLIVGNGLTAVGGAVERRHIDGVQLLLLARDYRVALVVAIQRVSRIPHTQFKIHLFIVQLLVEHRSLEDGGEQEELFIFAVGRLGDGKRLLQFDWWTDAINIRWEETEAKGNKGGLLREGEPPIKLTILLR